MVGICYSLPREKFTGKYEDEKDQIVFQKWQVTWSGWSPGSLRRSGVGMANLRDLRLESRQSSDVKRPLCQELRFSSYRQRGVFLIFRKQILVRMFTGLWGIRVNET